MPNTTAAIVAIGNELISGKISDTNSSHIARKLRKAGVLLKSIRLVADEESAIISALEEAAALAGPGFISGGGHFIITTGGLGPTSDDITRNGIARLLNVPLREHPASLQRLREYCERRNRPLHAISTRQAQFPEGAEIIPNSAGSADAFISKMPLVAGKSQEVSIFSLPGVPSEMKHLLRKEVLPWISRTFGDSTPIVTAGFRCFGVSESYLGTVIECCAIPAGIEIAYRPEFPEILIELSTAAAAGTAADVLENTRTSLITAIGEEYAFTRDTQLHLPEITGSLLQDRRQTLAVAESCSGGLLAHRIVSVAGASSFFLFSGVTYSNEAKTEFLGVSQATLAQFGAVSGETAKEMALGVQKRTNSDYALSVTGIAGPEGGTSDKPVGTVWIGLVSSSTAEVFHFLLPWERNTLREYSASLALDLLRRKILGLPLNWQRR